jgi:hypothetical protein
MMKRKEITINFSIVFMRETGLRPGMKMSQRVGLFRAFRKEPDRAAEVTGHPAETEFS